MSTPPTYSHVVEVNGPDRTVYLAGQTGVDATGKIAEGFRAQAVQVMETSRPRSPRLAAVSSTSSSSTAI
jgi:enamine deaminase RidA (YjgF/YER057c/UK114 family)